MKYISLFVGVIVCSMWSAYAGEMDKIDLYDTPMMVGKPLNVVEPTSSSCDIGQEMTIEKAFTVVEDEASGEPVIKDIPLSVFDSEDLTIQAVEKMLDTNYDKTAEGYIEKSRVDRDSLTNAMECLSLMDAMFCRIFLTNSFEQEQTLTLSKIREILHNNIEKTENGQYLVKLRANFNDLVLVITTLLRAHRLHDSLAPFAPFNSPQYLGDY